MLLYEAPGSPYVQKVKIALREKAVAFELELPESLGTGRTDGSFGLGNPRAEVPMLVDGETRIFDSTIILEYIEERWPDPPLLPREPKARAVARMTEDVCDTQYEAVTWGFSEVLWFGRATGALAATLRSAAARQTAVLQDWLAERLGEAAWFGGASFGWADAAVAPMLHRSVLNGMGPPPESVLAAWYERLCERPSVAATFAEYAASTARMPATVKAFKTGRKVREYRDHRLEWMIKSGGIEVVLAGLRDGTIRFPWPNPAVIFKATSNWQPIKDGAEPSDSPLTANIGARPLGSMGIAFQCNRRITYVAFLTMASTWPRENQLRSKKRNC